MTTAVQVQAPMTLGSAAPAGESGKALCEILARFDRDGVEYALLHPVRYGEGEIAGDVDIGFLADPRTVVTPILRAMEAEGWLQIVHCLHYDVLHGHYYILKITDRRGLYLHLDCLCDPFGVNRYHVPIPALLDGRARISGVVRLSADKEVLYTLIKRVMKGAFAQQKVMGLQQGLVNCAKQLEGPLTEWFGVEGREKLNRLCRTEDVQSATDLLNQLRTGLESRFRRAHLLSYLGGKLLSWVRRFRRFLRPSGLFVVLIGPDGSGKSTVAGLLPIELERAFRATWRFHWRPNLFPKLSRRDTDRSAGGSEGIAPPQDAAYGRVTSCVRFLYYLMDFAVGYWLVIYPRKARTTLIVGERYFADVVVNPQRYGFALPSWLLRLGARLVPNPDVTILLVNEPAVVHARKPELSSESISEQMRQYQEELPRWGHMCAVRTDGTPEDVVLRISHVLVQECATRLRNI